jgi:hypothetical protein
MAHKIAQQADSLERISPEIIATTPARKILVNIRPLIKNVGQTRMTRIVKLHFNF